MEVEEGVALDNIPEPKPIVGYKTKWEKFDTNNITSDLIINVIKTPIVYTITYNNNGKASKSSFTILDLPIKLKDAEHETKLFSGWYNSSDFSGEVIESIESIGDYELYANFVEGTKGLEFKAIDSGYSVNRYNGKEQSVVIPSLYKGVAVTSIGIRAFYDSFIKGITLPLSIVTIDDWAFLQCENLKSINIPDSVTSIGTGAFYNCKSLGELVIGNGTEVIEYRAFLGCSSLETIHLGNNIKKIKEQAFDVVSNAVYINDLENWLNIDFGVNANPISKTMDFFVNGKLLTELVVPASINTIKHSAFYNYYDLTKVILGKNVEYIESAAFANCGKLSNVLSCEGLKEIGASAFAECNNLQSISLSESIQRIGAKAFSNCSLMETITIPKSVKIIENEAFNTSPHLNYEVNYLGTIDDWCNISFGKNVFAYFSKLAQHYLKINGEVIEAVVVPQGIETISSSTFRGWYWLKSIQMPNSVKTIEERAFDGCVNLKTVSLDKDSVLSYIGESAFAHCSSLLEIELPFGIQYIGFDAFYNCTDLNKIILPSSLVYIGRWAFRYCSNLTIYSETTKPLEEWDPDWDGWSTFVVFWYSQFSPSESGNFWHYGENNEILVWETKSI